LVEAGKAAGESIEIKPVFSFKNCFVLESTQVAPTQPPNAALRATTKNALRRKSSDLNFIFEEFK
jgi:hypothetical protein